MPSTVIASIKYNAATCALTISFVSGLIYEYKNVPETTYNQLQNARSKGIFFNQHIKGKYRFEKIA